MNDYLTQYEDALFKAAIYEAAKDKSVILMEEASMIQEKATDELALKRFKKYIGKKFRKHNSKSFIKTALKITSRVAIVVMIFVTVMFSATISVEALRSRFIKFLMNVDEKYTELKLEEYDENGNPIEIGKSLGINNIYAPTYIPNGFDIISFDTMEYDTDIYYIAPDGNYISFMACTGTTVSRIDTENADRVENVNVGGKTGVLTEKDDTITLTWSNEDHYFILMSKLDESEIIKIADSVKLQR